MSRTFVREVAEDFGNNSGVQDEGLAGRKTILIWPPQWHVKGSTS